MCVGLSAKVLSVNEDTMIVDSGGAKRKVSAALLNGLKPGDYVMVHAGSAISRITDDDTDESASVWESFK
ncbi:MAG: HypC/HybG/HupF family hydrogenase formation chaperone [Lachnospiraceae bacterium]|nr:HypC/HybG/HupF family hydrogenase formation chaperone [Lachnospiraceae bacterium]